MKVGLYPTFATVDEHYEIDEETGCWEWLLGRSHLGYGRKSVNRVMMQAHRWMYEVKTGTKIPEGKILMHSCDNPPCVNPDHLSIGTHQDNVRDRVAKDRSLRGERHQNSKLTDEGVREMRRRFRSGEATMKQLSIEFGIASSCVSEAISGKTWGHVK